MGNPRATVEFGAFLAPWHKIETDANTAIHQDLQLVEHMDKLASPSSGSVSITPAVWRSCPHRRCSSLPPLSGRHGSNWASGWSRCPITTLHDC